jgi:hypothetical protein
LIGAPLLSAEGCHSRPRKFEFKQKGRQTAFTICKGLSQPTEWAALPSDNISGCFFQGWRNPLMIKIVLFFYFFIFFGGLECVGHSFAYVTHYVFLRYVWIRTQRAAIASVLYISSNINVNSRLFLMNKKGLISHEIENN